MTKVNIIFICDVPIIGSDRFRLVISTPFSDRTEYRIGNFSFSGFGTSLLIMIIFMRMKRIDDDNDDVKYDNDDSFNHDMTDDNDDNVLNDSKLV